MQPEELSQLVSATAGGGPATATLTGSSPFGKR